MYDTTRDKCTNLKIAARVRTGKQAKRRSEQHIAEVPSSDDQAIFRVTEECFSAPVAENDDVRLPVPHMFSA